MNVMTQVASSVTHARIVLPVSTAEAVAELARCGIRGRVVAGCTDLTIGMRRHHESPDVFVVVGNVAELRRIDEHSDGVTIGAAVTMAELAGSPLIKGRYTALADAAYSVGGVQIRNAATVGGNVCNASPGADTPPALLALGAVADIADAGPHRRATLEEFFLSPRRTVLAIGELLTGFHLTASPAQSGSAYLRLTSRNALDLAIVGVAAWIGLESDGVTVRDCRIALGAVAPTPILAPEAGDALRGKIPDAENIAEAALLALAACRPIDDVRASAAYRRAIVPVLVRRAILKALARARTQS